MTTAVTPRFDEIDLHPDDAVEAEAAQPLRETV
jgi:hypothetical protein